jgi:hypothetical protein
VHPNRIILILSIGLSMALGATAVAQAAPGGVTAAAFSERIQLSWQGGGSHQILRGTSKDDLQPLITVNGSAYSDPNVAPGTTYYYAVDDSRVVSAKASHPCSNENPIVAENCLDGINKWKVTDPEGIEGFATAQSVNHGESVDLKVKTSGTYNIEILRTGYYGGLGARQLGIIYDVPASPQPNCGGTGTGVVDCGNWSTGPAITTTASWPSGVYLLNLIPAAGGVNTNTVLLVVRDDQRRSELLYGVPDTTYQAYNNYGGKSLYDFNSSDGAQAPSVSYNRPYGQLDPTPTGYQPDGNQPNWYTRSDFATVHWLEQSGYDLTYTAVSDLETAPGRVLDHLGFISGAHDEYYSDRMRGALEAARDAGRHLFFTGSNAVYQRVRFAGRNMVDYKSVEGNPPDPSGMATGPWRHPNAGNRPENALLGAMYIGDLFPGGFYPLHVSPEEGRNRIWRHTGLDVQPPGPGTQVGTGLVGWEWDTRFANGFEPAGVETAASSPVMGNILLNPGPDYIQNGNAVAQTTRYVAPSGAIVVDTATNHWNRGLVPNGGLFADGESDVRIRQATTNILADMRVPPATPAPDVVYDPPPPGLVPSGPLAPLGPGAAPPQRVSGTIKASWTRSGRITKLKRLWATGVAKGSTIEIRCPDKRCGKKRTAIRASRDGTMALTRYVKQRKLRPGSVLEVHILAGGKIGKVTRYATRRKQAPRRLVTCLAPGAVKTGAC